MKHQQVSVDFWAMGRTMLVYGIMAVVGWMMLRMFNTMFSFTRMRQRQDNFQATLQDMQRRYPKLNITEEDLREAEKEIEQWNKEFEEKLKPVKTPEVAEKPSIEEDKKTI